MESKVLRVNYEISNNLNELPFFLIVDFNDITRYK